MLAACWRHDPTERLHLSSIPVVGHRFPNKQRDALVVGSLTFSKGKGWAYFPDRALRRVRVQGDVAWFYEPLRNDKYGEGKILQSDDGAVALVKLHEPHLEHPEKPRC